MRQGKPRNIKCNAKFAFYFALYTKTDFALSHFTVTTFAASIMIGSTKASAE